VGLEVDWEASEVGLKVDWKASEVVLEVDWEASKVGLEVDWEASEVGVLVRNLTTMRVNIGSMNTFIRQMVEGQTEQTTIAETTS